MQSHWELTGGKSKQFYRANSVVIALPKLVTGMLPKNGSGIVVAVLALEHHTAIEMGCDHLYTWGATYCKLVFDHEGVQWQPNLNEVPGAHRAVFVAAAKEHKSLLLTQCDRIPN
jgi:hypothetical protein